jgi:predicted small lipoprotein YifL
MSVRSVFLLGALLFLAACGNRNPLEVTVSRCPAVAVVGDAGTLTRFEGDSRNVEDVAFTASILDVRMTCEEAEDVRAQVTFDIGAQQGDAFRGRSVTVPYFVVVLKDNSQIVSKRVFDVTLRFDSNGNASSHEVVTQHIPTIEQARRYNYEVLLGFQLTAQDAVFNMER